MHGASFASLSLLPGILCFSCHPFFIGISEQYIIVKMEVYSPISSVRSALLTLHNYPLVTGPCSFIHHLNSPGGAYSLAATSFGPHDQSHTHKPSRSCQAPTGHSWVERVHVWVKALPNWPRARASTTNSAQPAIEPVISRLQVAHATIQPRRPIYMQHGILTVCEVFTPQPLDKHFLGESIENTCCTYIHSVYKQSVLTSPDWSDSKSARQSPGLGGPWDV